MLQQVHDKMQQRVQIDADGKASSVDPDQSDLGLHCLHIPLSQNFGFKGILLPNILPD